MAKLEQQCFVKCIPDKDEKIPILENNSSKFLDVNNEVVSGSSSNNNHHEMHVVLASLSGAVGSLCFGYCLGYSSPALPDLTTEPDDKVRLTDSQGSLFAVSLSYDKMQLYMWGITVFCHERIYEKNVVCS